MKIEITNKYLIEIGKIADENKIEAFAVGGFVRDKLLGKEVTDIDIVVVGDGIDFAKIVMKHFGKQTLVKYEKFGTAMLELGETKIEFVGARKESYSKDSRKPFVDVGTLSDDLSRRDFTINALAASINKNNFAEVLDPFDGKSDLSKKIIRTPLNPEITFDDDPLRMLRAVRFASQLNCEIDSATISAIVKMKNRITIVSQERITNEFLKILASAKPSIGLKLLFETGLMKIIFPEVEELSGVDQRQEFYHKDVFLHTCIVVDNISERTENIYLRLAALLHDIAKPRTKQFKEDIGWTFYGHEEIGARMLKNIFRKLKLPLTNLAYVEKLVRLHLRPMVLVSGGVTDSAVRRVLFEAGETIDDLMTLCRADITSKNPNLVEQYMNNYEVVYAKMKEVESKDKLRSFEPPVRGDEIIKILNLPPSKIIGLLKTAIEDAILDGTIPNEHDAALEYLLKIKDEILAKNENLLK